MQAAFKRTQKRCERQTNIVVFTQLLVLVVADHGRHLQLWLWMASPFSVSAANVKTIVNTWQMTEDPCPRCCTLAAHRHAWLRPMMKHQQTPTKALDVSDLSLPSWFWYYHLYVIVVTLSSPKWLLQWFPMYNILCCFLTSSVFLRFVLWNQACELWPACVMLSSWRQHRSLQCTEILLSSWQDFCII